MNNSLFVPINYTLFQEQSFPFFENGNDNELKFTDFAYPKTPSISLDENDDCNYNFFEPKGDDINDIYLMNPFEKPEKKVEIENNNTTVRTPEIPGQNFEIKDIEKNNEIKKKKTCKNAKEKKEGNDFLEKKTGRKRVDPNDNDEIQDESEGHNKFSEDNMMRKIKTNTMDYIYDKLNESLTDKSAQILKITKDVSEVLKIEYNMELMNKTLKEIIYNEPIRHKYKRNNYDNKYLIEKIFRENKEKKTIEILNKTYYDIIEEIRTQNLNGFLDKIVKKEKNMKRKSNIESYIRLLKDLLFRFKEWFEQKKPRNRNKNKEQKKEN